MKSDYETRAKKFLNVLMRLFMDCITLSDYIEAVEWYNDTHSRQIRWDNGVSRFVIVRADYVIKFDFKATGIWSDGCAGNNSTELKVYEQAVKAGMAHLLAKPTVVDMNGKQVTIMPRINHINDEDRDWSDYCEPLERLWLSRNVSDLHEGNVGYRDGKVCVVDYAWGA